MKGGDISTKVGGQTGWVKVKGGEISSKGRGHGPGGSKCAEWEEVSVVWHAQSSGWNVVQSGRRSVLCGTHTVFRVH